MSFSTQGQHAVTVVRTWQKPWDLDINLGPTYNGKAKLTLTLVPLLLGHGGQSVVMRGLIGEGPNVVAVKLFKKNPNEEKDLSKEPRYMGEVNHLILLSNAGKHVPAIYFHGPSDTNPQLDVLIGFDYFIAMEKPTYNFYQYEMIVRHLPLSIIPCVCWRILATSFDTNVELRSAGKSYNDFNTGNIMFNYDGDRFYTKSQQAFQAWKSTFGRHREENQDYASRQYHGMFRSDVLRSNPLFYSVRIIDFGAIADIKNGTTHASIAQPTSNPVGQQNANTADISNCAGVLTALWMTSYANELVDEQKKKKDNEGWRQKCLTIMERVKDSSEAQSWIWDFTIDTTIEFLKVKPELDNENTLDWPAFKSATKPEFWLHTPYRIFEGIAMCPTVWYSMSNTFLHFERISAPMIVQCGAEIDWQVFEYETERFVSFCEAYQQLVDESKYLLVVVENKNPQFDYNQQCRAWKEFIRRYEVIPLAEFIIEQRPSAIQEMQHDYLRTCSAFLWPWQQLLWRCHFAIVMLGCAELCTYGKHAKPQWVNALAHRIYLLESPQYSAWHGYEDMYQLSNENISETPLRKCLRDQISEWKQLTEYMSRWIHHLSDNVFPSQTNLDSSSDASQDMLRFLDYESKPYFLNWKHLYQSYFPKED